MKNVTKILTAVVLCAAMFASELRTKALGGHQFWPGDEANIAVFPAQANNHGYVQLSGIGVTGEDADGHASILFQKDGTTWGFNYNGDATAEGKWINMNWGDGDQGVSFGLANYSNNLTGDCNDDDTDDDTEVCLRENTGYKLGYGNTFSFGELGVHYMDTGVDDEDAKLDVYMKSDFGFWLFDDTYLALTDLTNDMNVRADFYSHMDAGGADVVYGWGIDMNMADEGYMHQTATIGVEANMTDWATFRAGYEWKHVLSADDKVTAQVGTAMVGTPESDNYEAASCDDGASVDEVACGVAGGTWTAMVGTPESDNYEAASEDYAAAFSTAQPTGANVGGFHWGLGFNWGGLTADFTVQSSLLLDPVGLVSARDAATGLTDTGITLTYSF